MWPFSGAVTKDKLQEWKKVRVNHGTFTIRKLNPLIDFPMSAMPQIFTSFVSRRPAPDPATLPPEAIAKIEEDLRSVLEKGVVKPELVAIGKGEKRGKEDGITADDLMRDDTGAKLYLEIIAHSLNRFKGVRGVFFSIKTRLSLFMQYRKLTGSLLYKPSSPMGFIP